MGEEKAAFCQRWSLHENAVERLRKMAPHVQAIVMKEFDPPSHMTEVSGKFIMFAASVEKAAQQQAQMGQSMQWRAMTPQALWEQQKQALAAGQEQEGAAGFDWPDA